MDYLEYRFDKFVFRVKKGLLYHEDGCWVKLDDSIARVGITDFLQSVNGDVAFVNLFSPSVNVKQGESFGDMETMKVSFELTSPVTGKIVEVNEGLKDSPELVNSDPYSAGWLLEIRATNLEGDRKRLLTAEEYFELMKEKVDEESSRMGKE